jgi:photosystem I P700 chlorophyll a apoprotein A1
MHFHGAYFSNYTAWLMNPLQIKPSAQSVWPVVGQEILNADVGGNFQGIQITSGSKFYAKVQLNNNFTVSL